MFRSKGDASEVAIYRALGKIPSLRKVHLSLLCPQSFLWDQVSYDEFTNLCDKGQYLDDETRDLLDSALVNLAMDKRLAHSIFNVISSAKPLFAQPLECLNLRITALQDFGGFTTSTLVDILRYVARSWVCDRKIRDDQPRSCFSREYDVQDVLDREEAEQWDELPIMDNSQYAQALCRVWPTCKQGDWKREWYSYELVDD